MATLFSQGSLEINISLDKLSSNQLESAAFAAPTVSRCACGRRSRAAPAGSKSCKKLCRRPFVTCGACRGSIAFLHAAAAADLRPSPPSIRATGASGVPQDVAVPLRVDVQQNAEGDEIRQHRRAAVRHKR